MLVHPLCCNDDRAGEIGPTFRFMTRHDLVLANDTYRLLRLSACGVPQYPRRLRDLLCPLLTSAARSGRIASSSVTFM